MRKLLLLLAFGLAATATLSAQCAISATQPFCGQTSCTALVSGGTIGATSQATITTTSSVTLPASCPSTGALTLGDVSFVIEKNTTLDLDPALGINAATMLTFSSSGPGAAGNTRVSVGGLSFKLTGNGPNGNISVLLNAIAACQASSTCTSLGAALGLAPFPVELLSWTARPLRDAIRLEWSSAAETDNDFYTIEHSLDGREFREMTRVAGSTSSAAVLRYQYVHAKPTGGVHYYRLSQQDLDGTREVFDVISVDFNGTGATAAIRSYPNPVTAGQQLELTVSNGRAGETAQLFDAGGRAVATTTLRADGRASLAVPAHLAPGLYVLRAGADSQRLLVGR